MLFKKFIEIGRVVLIKNGPFTGKLAVVVDVATANRILVDGPNGLTGVHRHLIPIRWVALTKFKVNVPLNASERKLKKAFHDDKILEQWAQTSAAKKMNMKKRRAETTDFDRFKVRVARRERARLIKAAA